MLRDLACPENLFSDTRQGILLQEASLTAELMYLWIKYHVGRDGGRRCQSQVEGGLKD